MSVYIVNLRDEKFNQDNYIEYSTIVDDFNTTSSMSLEEFKQYYIKEEGENSANELEERLKRVFEKGNSSRIYDSAEDTICCNRAGYYVKGYVQKPKTEESIPYNMTYEEILDVYCRPFYKERKK